MNDLSCPRCGYPSKQVGKSCEVCQAGEAYWLTLPLGYIYPAEARMVKLLLTIFVCLLIIAIIVGVLLYNDLDLRIHELSNLINQ